MWMPSHPSGGKLAGPDGCYLPSGRQDRRTSSMRTIPAFMESVSGRRTGQHAFIMRRQGRIDDDASRSWIIELQLYFEAE